MALELESGIVAGQAGLLSALNDHIDSGGSGWSVEEYKTVGSDTWLVLRMGTAQYFHLQTSLGFTRPRLRLDASTAVDGSDGIGGGHTGETPTASAGTTGYAAISIPKTDNLKYWFHSDDSYLWISCLMEGGWWQHAFLGRLDLFPGVNNGFYIGGSCRRSTDPGGALVEDDFDNVSLSGTELIGACSPIGPLGRAAANDTATRHYVRNHAGDWLRVSTGSATSTTLGRLSTDHSGSGVSGSNPELGGVGGVFMPAFQVHASNIVATLQPVHLFAPHSALSGRMAPMGTIPGGFYVWTENIPEEGIIEIGDDDYIVFPACKTRRVAHSQRYAGVAIRTKAD